MENDLKEFVKEEQRLFDDIPGLTYKEAKNRCDALWGLIPINYDVNSVRIDNLMYEKFHDDPDWKYGRVFYIQPEDLKDSDVLSYMKKIQKKIQKQI